MSLQEAHEIVSTVKGLTANAECVATLDPVTAGRALENAKTVFLLMGMPSIEYTNAFIQEKTWDAFVISGPADDPIAAWKYIEQVMGILEDNQDALNLTNARPDSVQITSGSAYSYPAYRITFTS